MIIRVYLLYLFFYIMLSLKCYINFDIFFFIYIILTIHVFIFCSYYFLCYIIFFLSIFSYFYILFSYHIIISYLILSCLILNYIIKTNYLSLHKSHPIHFEIMIDTYINTRSKRGENE